MAVGEHERQQHAEHGDGEGERAGRERYDARSVEAYGEMADKRKPRHNGVDDASGRIRCDAESDASGDDEAYARCKERPQRHVLRQRFRQSEEIGKHHGLHGALLFRPLELALLVQLGGDYG